MNQEILNEVKETIKNVLMVEKIDIKLNDYLASDLGLDVVDIIEITLHLEDVFGDVEFDIWEVKTVEDIYNLFK